MVWGLLSNWKQAVGYFLSSGPIDSKLLHTLLLECIDTAEEAGLKVKVVIADQGSNNRKTFDKLCKITEAEPFFCHKDKRIYVIYDPPHLLKNIRNNLKKNGFVVNGKEVKWIYIEQFYNFDRQNAVRIAPKLTAKHIDLPPFAPLRVKYAVQVLSHTVAAGLSTLIQLGVLASDAKETALFIERFDQLFNAFNSGNLRSTQRMTHGMSQKSGHKDFLLGTLDWLKTVQSHSAHLPCLSGWMMSVRSLLALWEDLHTNHGVKFLLTDRLNQDCVENLFSCIRGKGGHGDNPSADQFRMFLRQAMVDSFFVHSDASNCMEDTAKCLLTLNSMTSLMENGQVDDPDLPAEPPLPADGAEEDDIGLLYQIAIPAPLPKDPALLQAEDNVLTYIAGYVAKRLKHKVCEGCNDVLTGAPGVPITCICR